MTKTRVDVDPNGSDPKTVRLIWDEPWAPVSRSLRYQLQPGMTPAQVLEDTDEYHQDYVLCRQHPSEKRPGSTLSPTDALDDIVSDLEPLYPVYLGTRQRPRNTPDGW